MPADVVFQRRVGTTLNGKYRLEELLGAGGMAAVYRATHRNGHRVAVKLLHAELCAQVELRDRFLREGYVANRLNHQGAVRVLDDDMADDGSVFLVMELLEGETLDARWQAAGRRLPHREVAEWAVQALDVLAVAHERGIVHRDIKPENLFVTREGHLKALDFGIARLSDSPLGRDTTATRVGHVLGTPAFLPPEQALGRSRDIDGQTDLWALGATMFTLISGRHVHEGETVAEMIVYAGSRNARSLLSVAPDVPPELAAVVDRALEFEKADRWPDARSMREALEGGSGFSASLPKTSVPPARHPAESSHSRPPVVAPTSTTGGVEGRPSDRPPPAGPRSRAAWAVVVAATAALATGSLYARWTASRTGASAAAVLASAGVPVVAAVVPSPSSPETANPAFAPVAPTPEPAEEVAPSAEAPAADVHVAVAAVPRAARARHYAAPASPVRDPAGEGNAGHESADENGAQDERRVSEVLSGLRGADEVAAAAPRGVGFLNINSIPPSFCFVDGKAFGATPKIHVSVPSGTHQVKFVGYDPTQARTLTVTVEAGTTKVAAVNLTR